MLVSKEQLEACIPIATKDNIEKYLLPLNETLAKFSINTPIRIASFLAQIAHESCSLRYCEEIASGSAYEFRKDLGNLEAEALQIAHANYTTSGKFYKGKGLIQLTGFYNYKKCGESLKVDLIHNPKLLNEAEWACASAGWFWHTHGCNELADKGLFGAITKIINGGTTGASDRLKHYYKCRKVFP